MPPPNGQAGRGPARGAIIGTSLLLSLFVALLLGALVAVGTIDGAYAGAQDQAERALRALLRPALAPRGAAEEMGELISSLEKLDRVAVRVDLDYPAAGLAATWASYAAGVPDEEARLDRVVTAMGLVESGLAAKRDSLNRSFYALAGALALCLVASIIAAAHLRTRLSVSRLEADWRARSLRSSLSAEEALRRRIARELHDDAAQDLAAAKMLCESAAASPELSAWRVAEAATLLGEAGRKLRGLALDLRPPELERSGLARALEALCERYSRSDPGRVSFSCPAALPPLPDETAIQAYRIVQEALANARKHAPGNLVEVLAEDWAKGEGRTGFVVTVRDFPPSTPGDPAPSPRREGAAREGPDPALSSGLGLEIMHERAALARCFLRVELGAKGSSVRLFVPAGEKEGTA